MGALFRREGIEANTWEPEVCGVNFTERVAKALGEYAVQGIEIWTAWADISADETGEAVTIQLTQDNCLVEMSAVDDDADSVAILDPRDGQWFRYSRLTQDPTIFEFVVETVSPWATRISSPVPRENAYAAIMRSMTVDLDEMTPDMFD